MGERVRYEEAPQSEGKGYEAVADAINKLRDEIGTRHTENTSSLEVLEKDLKVVIDRVDDLAKGFPAGDWEGHRLYHEAIIRRANERAELYKALREEIAKKGLWAFLLALGGLIWLGISAKFHLGGK